MFKMIDTDNSGHITLEELKIGLEKVGANLQESEIIGLMEAVSVPPTQTSILMLLIQRHIQTQLSQRKNFLSAEPQRDWISINHLPSRFTSFFRSYG